MADESKKVYLNYGTRIAGKHCEPGKVVECDPRTAHFLINTNKGDEYDPKIHKQSKGKGAN